VLRLRQFLGAHMRAALRGAGAALAQRSRVGGAVTAAPSAETALYAALSDPGWLCALRRAYGSAAGEPRARARAAERCVCLSVDLLSCASVRALCSHLAAGATCAARHARPAAGLQLPRCRGGLRLRLRQELLS